MTPEQTDEELALLARTQTYAFGVLMQRYEMKLLQYILRISRVTREGAEDILQESFLKAYQNINSFDTSLSFSSWIYRIVHNMTISTWRKKNVRPEGHENNVDEEFFGRIAGQEDVMRDIDQQFLRQHIGTILDTMQDHYKEILILFFIEDKSYKEISAILKKPMGTVATRVNRAKTQFRLAYEKSYNKEQLPHL